MSTTAEIREALEYALRDMEFAAQAPAYWQRACDRMKQALALLADMEREEGPVAWLNEYMGLTMNDRSKRTHDSEGTKHGYTIPLYRHPSPTTADAMDSTVDVQEVVKAGDAMASRLKLMETGAGLQAVWSEITKTFRP